MAFDCLGFESYWMQAYRLFFDVEREQPIEGQSRAMTWAAESILGDTRRPASALSFHKQAQEHERAVLDYMNAKGQEAAARDATLGKAAVLDLRDRPRMAYAWRRFLRYDVR